MINPSNNPEKFFFDSTNIHADMNKKSTKKEIKANNTEKIRQTVQTQFDYLHENKLSIVTDTDEKFTIEDDPLIVTETDGKAP